MKFKNPQNGYIEEAFGPYSWLWVLLIGPIYFLSKRNYFHAVLSLLLAITLGIIIPFVGAFFVWIFYAVMVKEFNKTHYLRRGWIEVKEDT